MQADSRVPFVTLPNWIQAAGICGFQIEPLFTACGIQPDLIHLEQASISLGEQDQLMRACVSACAEHAPELHFPFVLGESFGFEYMPELATYISTSANLREASKALTWVQALVNPFIDLRLHEQGGIAQLQLRHQELEQSQEHIYYTESVLSSVWHFARLLLGKQAPLRLMRFRHPPPAYADKYEQFLRLPIAFNQAEDCLEIEAALLDKPLQGAAPQLHEQAEFLVEQRLAQRPARQGYSARVKIHLEQNGQRYKIEDCARALKLQPRSLQRRLQAEGSCYAELLDETRFEQAVKSLQKGHAHLDQLSEDLGFADRRSFSRAFKRWSGLSPSQYRKSLKQ